MRSFQRLKRNTTSSIGARRWFISILLIVLSFYFFSATFFAIRIFKQVFIIKNESETILKDTKQQQESLLKKVIQIQKVDDWQTFEKQQKPNSKEEDIHIVFSTGCNLFQHWQAEVVLYSHFKVGQKGKITRVVSGCDTEHIKRKHGKFLTHPGGLADEPVSLSELKRSTNPNFRLHVTPSFEGAREFPWINKPMGLAHWFEHANPPVTESVIVIIDPDMFFLDKLKIGGSRSIIGNERPYGAGGILCSSGCKGGQIFDQSPIGLTDEVKLGRPIGQTYGLGGGFVYSYNISAIVEPNSPARKLNFERAARYYSVGPPMIAQHEDMKKIFSKWTVYMNPVFQQHPGDIQADMYAYSLAAAHFGLDHFMMDQFMVSSPNVNGEGWPYVEQYFKHSLKCSNPNEFAKEPTSPIPTFLHVAQRYDSETTDFMFHKGHVPPNIFRCDLPILVFPPENIIDEARTRKDKQKMYMLCNAYVLINEALLAWKSKFCSNEYNTKQGIMLQKHSQSCGIWDNPNNKCWIFARVV